MKRIVIFGVACVFVLCVVGCGEPTQNAAQDSQEQIRKEMKESGDDKNAY